MSEDNYKTLSKRTAKLYFKPGSESMVKDMAARIRGQHSFCHLVDMTQFQSEEDVQPCNAVLIYGTSKKAKLIATCYENFGTPGVEIMFFDDQGHVINEEHPEPAATEPVQETEADSTGSDTEATGHAEFAEVSKHVQIPDTF